MISWGELNRRAGGGRIAHPARFATIRVGGVLKMVRAGTNRPGRRLAPCPLCHRKHDAWPNYQARINKRNRRHNRNVAAQYAAEKGATT
jgi:hypothetical protein